jgi:hypothetical protein
MAKRPADALARRLVEGGENVVNVAHIEIGMLADDLVSPAPQGLVGNRPGALLRRQFSGVHALRR